MLKSSLFIFIKTVKRISSSALDNESQKLVQAALDDLQSKHPRTTLTVAHRLLTVKDCDKIAFMGDGGVLEVRKRLLYITLSLGNVHVVLNHVFLLLLYSLTFLLSFLRWVLTTLCSL